MTDEDFDAISKKTTQIDNIKSSAAIIYDLITGKEDREETQDDEEENIIKVENYTWKIDGGKKFMDRVEREAFYPDYHSDMSSEEEALFESKFA